MVNHRVYDESVGKDVHEIDGHCLAYRKKYDEVLGDGSFDFNRYGENEVREDIEGMRLCVGNSRKFKSLRFHIPILEAVIGRLEKRLVGS